MYYIIEEYCVEAGCILLPMGITNALKTEMVNTITKNVIQNPDKDCRVQYSGAAIGIDVLRWQLWASYKLPYASGLKAPDCPYTLKKHLSGETKKNTLGFGS